uniref:Tc1-like transposase DDE domain-containing protein n=1 Tax=Caenorhabditis japonica TaxID=281687 RepID=A0A8R1EIU4_CAEJA
MAIPADHHVTESKNGPYWGTSAKVWVAGCNAQERKEDYHSEMNAPLYEEYMMEEVIPVLKAIGTAEQRRVILVIDNASYHCRAIDKVIFKEKIKTNVNIKSPPINSRKRVLLDFLATHGINMNVRSKEPEIVQRLKTFIENNGVSSAFKKYVVDKFVRERGVTMVRLPPYHCFLSSIELMRAQLKQKVMASCSTKSSLEQKSGEG